MEDEFKRFAGGGIYKELGGYKIKEIAKKYGVAMSTISEIKNGNNWKHITLGDDYAHTEISQ